MTVARSVAEVLDQHVDFEVECIDRMHLAPRWIKWVWPGVAS